MQLNNCIDWILWRYINKNYYYICLSMLANGRLQFLLDRLGTRLKLFVSTDSTSCHEFASQFGLAFCLYTKNTQKLSQRPTLVHTWLLNEPATPVTMRSRLNRQRPVEAATTAVKLSGYIVRQNIENHQVKTATKRDSRLEKCGLGITT